MWYFDKNSNLAFVNGLTAIRNVKDQKRAIKNIFKRKERKYWVCKKLFCLHFEISANLLHFRISMCSWVWCQCSAAHGKLLMCQFLKWMHQIVKWLRWSANGLCFQLNDNKSWLWLDTGVPSPTHFFFKKKWCSCSCAELLRPKQIHTYRFGCDGSLNWWFDSHWLLIFCRGRIVS